MKIRHMIATAGLALAAGGLAVPALAQTTVEHSMHREVTTTHDAPVRHEAVVERRTVVDHERMGDRDHMVRRDVIAHNEHHENRSWHSNRWHNRHCRTVWHNHHRVRRCW